MSNINIRFNPPSRRGNPPARSFNFIFNGQPDFAYLWGYFIGDGYLCQDRPTLGWLCGDENATYLEGLMLRYLPDLPPSKFLDRKLWRLTIGSKGLHDILLSLGFTHGAFNKVIPPFLMDSSIEVHRAVLQGLFDSDGTASVHVSKQGGGYRVMRVGFCSTSQTLVDQVKLLAEEFGVSFRSYVEPHSDRKTIHRLSISSKDSLSLFKDRVGFRLGRKQGILIKNSDLLIPLKKDGDHHTSQREQLAALVAVG